MYRLRHYWSKIFKMLPEPVSKLLMTDLCIIKEIIILYTQPSERKFRWKLYLSKQVSRISLKGKPLKKNPISFFFLFFFFFSCSHKKANLRCLVSCAHHHWLWSTKREKIIGSGEFLLFFGGGVGWHSAAQKHLPRKPCLFIYHSAQNVYCIME